MRNFYSVFVLFLLVSFSAFSQVIGDFRSRADGNWSDVGTWQRFGGVTWANATSLPTATSAVTIRNGHAINVNGNYSCASLTLTAPTSSNTTRLTVQTGNTLTVSGNVQVSGGTSSGRDASLRLEGTGILDVSGGVTLTATAGQGDASLVMAGSGRLAVTGALTNTNGTFTTTGSTSTVEFRSSLTQTIPALNYHNLTSSGIGTRTLANSGTIGISGTFTPGTNTYTTAGSTVDYNGTSSQTVAAFNYNNLTISNTGSVTLPSAGTVGVAGTFSPSSSATYTVTGSTVNYNGSGGQTIAAFSYNNLTSSGVGSRTLASSGTISVAGTLTSGTNAYTTTGSTVRFNGGSTVQTFSGVLGTVTYPFNNLTVNTSTNTSGGLQLSAATYVAGVCSIPSGRLMLNQQTLYITSSSTGAITPATGGGIIVSEDASTNVLTNRANNNSKVAWTIGTTAGDHTIPFGKSNGTDYIPFTINRTTGDLGTISVGTYQPTGPLHTPYPATVNHVYDNTGTNTDNSGSTVQRFWEIDKTGGGATFTASVTFSFAASEQPVNNTGGATTNLRAQRWTGNYWDTALPGQTSTSTSVTVPGVTQFSPWALAKALSPLPVQLLYFRAEPAGDKVLLKWATASEINSESFRIEKSTDGHQFSQVYLGSAAGNSAAVSLYETEDEASRSEVYYRLKQKDFNGKEEVISLVTLKGAAGDVISNARIVTGNSSPELLFTASGEQSYHISVYAVSGQRIYTGHGLAQDGVNRLSLPVTVPAGMYIVQLDSGSFRQQLKAVK
jgi:hypothetical protein